jgi:hypothetical protein
MLEQISGVDFYGVNRNTKRKVQFGNYIMWFPKGEKTSRQIQKKMVEGIILLAE